MDLDEDLQPIPSAAFVDGITGGVHHRLVVPGGDGNLPRFVALRAERPGGAPGDGPHPPLVVYRYELDPAAYRVHRTYASGQPAITCPTCGATSFHPRDIAEGYCGACHAWTRWPRWVVLRPKPGHDVGLPDRTLGWHDLQSRTLACILDGRAVVAEPLGMMTRRRDPIDPAGHVYGEVLWVRRPAGPGADGVQS